MYYDEEEYNVNSIEAFLSSIIGNIVSNIALHAIENENASIAIYNKTPYIIVDFKNAYKDCLKDTSLGLDFCQKLAKNAKIDLKFTKTKDEVCVNLKIPSLKDNLKRQIIGI